MYTQFFGNFLLSKGYITNQQLFLVPLKEKAQKHAKLGTLAIHSGLMTAAEVDLSDESSRPIRTRSLVSLQ